MNDLTFSSVLIDVELPAPTKLSPALIGALSPLRVVLLGWFPVPEQTSPEHARDMFAGEAQDALDAVARRFAEMGTEVATRLVFTGDKRDTFTRISTEENCDGVLIPGTMDEMRRILVPLRGLENLSQIAPFVGALCKNNTATATLLHVVEGERTEGDSGIEMLEQAQEQMQEDALDADRIGLELIPNASPTNTILDRAGDHDLMVLGETRPSVQDILFGTVPERIATSTDMPIVIVRDEDEAIEAAEQTMEAGSN